MRVLILSLTYNGGETCCDYPVIGYIDSNLTTSSSTHQYVLKDIGVEKDYIITFPDSGSHYIMIGYRKDGSETKSPDNATVYIKDYA